MIGIRSKDIVSDITTLVECPYCKTLTKEENIGLVCDKCVPMMTLDLAVAECLDNLSVIRNSGDKELLRRINGLHEIIRQVSALDQKVNKLKG